jgi:hypothetical protein
MHYNIWQVYCPPVVSLVTLYCSLLYDTSNALSVFSLQPLQGPFTPLHFSANNTNPLIAAHMQMTFIIFFFKIIFTLWANMSKGVFLIISMIVLRTSCPHGTSYLQTTALWYISAHTCLWWSIKLKVRPKSEILLMREIKSSWCCLYLYIGATNN